MPASREAKDPRARHPVAFDVVMAARKPQHTFMKPKWPAVGMRVRVERDGEWYEGEVTALTADRSEAAVVYTEDADRFEEGGVDVGARLCGDSLLRAREGI